MLILCSRLAGLCSGRARHGAACRCSAKCPFYPPLDRPPDQFCRLLDRLPDQFAKHGAARRCHVMERESFEDVEVGELLNAGFVPIKVDREERPDVDKVYVRL